MTIKFGMVMAAGFGTRLKPLTDNIPKPLIQVNGKALIDYAIENLICIGIKKIIVNTHYLSNQIHNHLLKYKHTNTEIIISHEPKILGSGGGILNVIRNITKQPMMVVNADVYFDNVKPFQVILDKWKPKKMDLLLTIKDKKEIDYSESGDFNLSQSNKIYHSAVCENNYVLTSPYIITPEFFLGHSVKPFSIIDIIFKANDETSNDFRFYGVKNNFKWFDVGTHERLKKLNQYLLRQNSV